MNIGFEVFGLNLVQCFVYYVKNHIRYYLKSKDYAFSLSHSLSNIIFL